MIEAFELNLPDGPCDAWLARPKGQGPWPGVILAMDAVGPRPTLERMAERLADAGYVVLLPNLFYRAKRAPIVTGVPSPAQASDVPAILAQIMPLVRAYDPERGLGDVDDFVSYLKTRADVKPGRLGIFGYCMGGAMSIRAGARFPDVFGAVASFHAGGLVTDDPQSPHRLLPKLKAALYVGHADEDPHLGPEQIKIFDDAAAAMTAPHQTELYVGAHHHFTMADLPAYDAAASERHWARLLRLFKENL